MNWKVKAIIQQVFSHIPFGEQMNYLGQRYIIRNLPRKEDFWSNVSHAQEHFNNFRKHGMPMESPIFYEFGVGWDLIIPLTYYLMGIDHQILVDIRPLLRKELINDTLKRLYMRQHELSMLSRKFERPICIQWGSANEIKELFGMVYLAPCDARNVSILDRNSVDFITSTGVLEHVPARDVAPILRECERLLKPGCVMSHAIGYFDHYSVLDPKTSIYNFLKYSDLVWRFFSPSLHYQNRLRHKDYLTIIRASTNLKIVDEIIHSPTTEEMEKLRQIRLAQRFRANYTLDDLAVKGATLVLRKEPT